MHLVTGHGQQHRQMGTGSKVHVRVRIHGVGGKNTLTNTSCAPSCEYSCVELLSGPYLFGQDSFPYLFRIVLQVFDLKKLFTHSLNRRNSLCVGGMSICCQNMLYVWSCRHAFAFPTSFWQSRNNPGQVTLLSYEVQITWEHEQLKVEYVFTAVKRAPSFCQIAGKDIQVQVEPVLSTVYLDRQVGLFGSCICVLSKEFLPAMTSELGIRILNQIYIIKKHLSSKS